VSSSGTYTRTRSFELRAPQARVTPQTLPSAPPPDLPPPTRAQIGLRAGRLASESLYASLGVESTASAEEIRAAFFRLARAWRPDRLPPVLGDMRPHAAAVFARMEEAHRTLTSPEARARYDLFSSKRATQMTRMDAEPLFHEAENAVGRKDYAVAAALVGRARELVPDEGRYEALSVWIEALAMGGAGLVPEAKVRELILRLDYIIDADSDCDKALFYRASFWKRLGNESVAHRDFARVTLLDPQNIDAAREVHLYRTRRKR
jgi:hypothetical protein